MSYYTRDQMQRIIPALESAFPNGQAKNRWWSRAQRRLGGKSPNAIWERGTSEEIEQIIWMLEAGEIEPEELEEGEE